MAASQTLNTPQHLPRSRWPGARKVPVAKRSNPTAARKLDLTPALRFASGRFLLGGHL